MNYVIGIDIGTSSTKTVLFDERLNAIASSSVEYPLYHPKNGWAEQKPEDWKNATLNTIKAVISESGVAGEDIKGIGLSGQMHGLVMLDENNEVIRNSIIWCDQRTAKECEEITEKVGKERLIEITANPALTGFTASKILWVRNNEPENYKKCKHILLPKDYIRFILTGEYATEVSDASGMQLLDVKNRCWSDEVLEKLEIDKNMLGKVYESVEVTGKITKEIAELTGLSANTVVVGGAGDNAAAAVGTGTVGDAMCNISLGTSGTIFISSKEFGVDQNNALHAFAHADGHFHLMGCMLSAASCNKWWMEEILQTKEFASEQIAITEDMLGRNHVYFLPYLMGERSPHNDASARGTFIGMTMDTSRADMYQAVLEGVAFAIRDSFEIAKSLGMDIKRSKICGGGAKSLLWKKMIANVLNIDIDVIESEEGPGYGGAILAAVACGEYASVEEAASKLIKVVNTIKPEPEIAARYEERYHQFTKIYPAVKELFPKIQ